MVALDAVVDEKPVLTDINPPVVVMEQAPAYLNTDKVVKFTPDGRVLEIEAKGIDVEERNGELTAVISSNIESVVSGLSGEKIKGKTPEEIGKAIGESISDLYRDGNAYELIKSVSDSNIVSFKGMAFNFKHYREELSKGPIPQEIKDNLLEDLSVLGLNTEGPIVIGKGRGVLSRNEDRLENMGLTTFGGYGDRSARVLSAFPVMCALNRDIDKIEDAARNVLRSDKAAMAHFKESKAAIGNMAKVSAMMYFEGARLRQQMDLQEYMEFVENSGKLYGRIKSWDRQVKEACREEGLEVRPASVLKLKGKDSSGNSVSNVLSNEYFDIIQEIWVLGFKAETLRERLVFDRDFIDKGQEFTGGRDVGGKGKIDRAFSGINNVPGKLASGSEMLRDVVDGGFDSNGNNFSFASLQDPGIYGKGNVQHPGQAVSTDNSRISSFVSETFMDGKKVFSKEDAVGFMVYIGSRCLEQGIKDKDMQSVRLGRVLQAQAKRMLAPSFSKDDVIISLNETIKNFPVCIGNIDSLYLQYRQKENTRDGAAPDFVFPKFKATYATKGFSLKTGHSRDKNRTDVKHAGHEQ